MQGLSAALYTAALAFVAKIGFDWWERRQDRRGVAGALAGELEAYVSVWEKGDVVANLGRIVKLDRETRRVRLKAMIAPPTGHPVFDKVADKIGCLWPTEAAAVSRIYNLVTSMRVLMTGLSSDSFLAGDDDMHKTMLTYMQTTIRDELVEARKLIVTLTRIAY